MIGDPSPSPFELAAAKLCALGITLARLPDDYRVNFHNAGDATALPSRHWTRPSPAVAAWRPTLPHRRRESAAGDPCA